MEWIRSQVVPWGQQCCLSLQHTAWGETWDDKDPADGVRGVAQHRGHGMEVLWGQQCCPSLQSTAWGETYGVTGTLGTRTQCAQHGGHGIGCLVLGTGWGAQGPVATTARRVCCGMTGTGCPKQGAKGYLECPEWGACMDWGEWCLLGVRGAWFGVSGVRWGCGVPGLGWHRLPGKGCLMEDSQNLGVRHGVLVLGCSVRGGCFGALGTGGLAQLPIPGCPELCQHSRSGGDSSRTALGTAGSRSPRRDTPSGRRDTAPGAA